jgi:hypothetical protein
LGQFDIGAIRAQLLVEPNDAWSTTIAMKKGNEVHRDDQ